MNELLSIAEERVNEMLNTRGYIYLQEVYNILMDVLPFEVIGKVKIIYEDRVRLEERL